MRPLRLELRGFTAFRNETVVDFEHRHLFAITGPTGAGKSSLLDAITWALYGQVPRVGNQARQLMSQGAAAMAVRFDFRVRGETYRVSRQISKTMAARLDREVAPGDWRSLADKARDVATEVERILGLDYDTFTKTVLLPQGAFDAFLRGDPGQRRDILSNLLGLSVYEQMREGAQARVVGSRNRAEEQRQQADRLADATPEAIAALDTERGERQLRIALVREQRERLAALVALERAASDAAREAASAQSATTNAKRARAVAEAALAEAEQTLAEATARLASIAAERTTLAYDAARHRTLEQQAAQVRQAEQARADVAHAEQAHAEAEQAREQTRVTAAETAAAAKRATAQQTKATKSLAAARTSLARAAGQTAIARARLQEQHARLEVERADAARGASEAEERVRLLDALAKQAGEVTSDLERADGDVQRVTAAAAVAEAARVRAEADVTAALAAYEVATVAREAATREHSASALRRGLTVGDPCPVCGEPITSLAEHAAPDLDAAFAAVEEAERTLQSARSAHEQRLGDARSAHARVDAANEAMLTVRARLETVEATATAAGIVLVRIEEARTLAADAVSAASAKVAEAERASLATVEQERALALLLATVPPDVEQTAEPDGDPGDVEQMLRDALAVFATASAAALDAETIARTAGEAARAATAAVTHAEERVTVAAASASAARTRLEALAPALLEDSEALLAALAEAERLALRHAELEQQAQEAARAQAAETSRLDERKQAVVLTSAEAEERTRATSVAMASATAAADAYAGQWRDLKDVTTAPDAETLAEMSRRLEQSELQAATALGMLEARVEQARAQQVEAERLRVEAAQHEQAMRVAGGLEQDLRRNNFIAYVQREAMQVLAAEAGLRMEHLSRGRYRMRADGDEFVVIDRLNGDEQRSVKTLSGGETFLASLALALALAERLPQLAGHGGAISLESLFLDEGFGTLDADALDVAIEALELLAGENRMIGVISHVPLIAERLPDRIEVLRVGGSSIVRG